MLDLLPRARSHAARFPRAFWVLLAGEGAQSLGYGLIVPFFALYLTDTIGASEAEAGVILALWSVVAIAGHPVGGVLADRIGRRPVMIGGLVGSAVASIAFGFASSELAVAGLVLFWGTCNSIFEPAVGAYVADVTPRELRTEAYGLQRVANNAFFAIGPPVGALLIYFFSLRATFVAAGALVLAYLTVVWRGLPETRPEAADDEPPARFREALRDRLLLVLISGTAVATLAYGVYESALPVFYHEERGLSIATWGLIFGINPVVIAVFQYPLARWSGRQSSRLVLAGGGLLHGLALALIWPFEGIGMLVAGLLVFTLGEMLLIPVATALAAELAPPRLRGSYQGALNLAWEGAFGPATLAGLWLVGRGQGELLLALGLPVGVLSALVFLALPGGRLRGPPAVAPVDPARPLIVEQQP